MPNPPTNIDHILTLGAAKFNSPLGRANVRPGKSLRFISETERILYKVEIDAQAFTPSSVGFEKAGPRRELFFEPSNVTAAIVTCGGLSPGLNNVLRSATFELIENYGVAKVLGYKYGFSGLASDCEHPPKSLTPGLVADIHKLGGSLIGSSRGFVEIDEIIATLKRDQVNLLLCIGGDGTQRGVHKIATELLARKEPIAVIGIPKTIDNDVPYVFNSFGFASAVEQAQAIILRAATEARGFLNTVAIVKLMGRDAGFIASHATLAAQEVDFALIPEAKFKLDGQAGLLAAIEQKIKRCGSCVVVLSEGAGQEFFKDKPEQRDDSGNRRQHDIGVFLRDQIEDHFAALQHKINIRYFDPSYAIRAVPANSNDAFYCDKLARAAVHAGMAGKTDLLIGQWYNNLTHVPLAIVTEEKKRINPDQELWRDVLAVTGQCI